MEHIKEALAKAKTSPEKEANAPATPPTMVPAPPPTARRPEDKAPTTSRWTPPQIQLDPKLLARNRIVSFAMSHRAHVAFNLLRTRVRKLLRDNGWTKLAITSPTPGCGKTMVALNLAFSLARATDTRIVLVDLDLKRPALARTLGVTPSGSIGQVLKGNAEATDCFVGVGPNLVLGLNADLIPESSELIHAARMDELLEFIYSSIAADIVLFDLPPMRTSDDALAFLPRADASLLVAAAGATTVAEIDECEQQISQLEKFVAVVLNKSDEDNEGYYY